MVHSATRRHIGQCFYSLHDVFTNPSILLLSLFGVNSHFIADMQIDNIGQYCTWFVWLTHTRPDITIIIIITPYFSVNTRKKQTSHNNCVFFHPSLVFIDISRKSAGGYCQCVLPACTVILPVNNPAI